MQAGGMAGNRMMPMTSMPQMAKKGAKVITKTKKGGSFPDLNKDGKITKADILKGRGVIAKKGAKVAKAKPMKKMMGGCKCRNGC